MINKLALCVFTCIGLLFALPAAAQDKPAMADVMRSNGKIYVVVAVCLTILVGLFLYILNVDRKIKKIEQHR